MMSTDGTFWSNVIINGNELLIESVEYENGGIYRLDYFLMTNVLIVSIEFKSRCSFIIDGGYKIEADYLLVIQGNLI